MNPQHQSSSPRQANRRVHTPPDTKDSPPPEGARRVTRQRWVRVTHSQGTRSEASRCEGSPGKSPPPASQCQGRVSWARPAAPKTAPQPGFCDGAPLIPPARGWVFQVAKGAPMGGTGQPRGTDVTVIGDFCRARPLVPALCQSQRVGTVTPRQTK